MTRWSVRSRQALAVSIAVAAALVCAWEQREYSGNPIALTTAVRSGTC